MSNLKHIAYIANVRIPTEKAHGIQIMEMCTAFADQGYEVELVVPRRVNALRDNPFEYHDVREVFAIRKLPCLDLVRYGRFGFFIETFSFLVSSALYKTFSKNTIIYTRDELTALYFTCVGKEVVWEGHTGQKNFAVRLLMRLSTPFVVITEGIKSLYVRMGVSESRILVAPDGADLNRFNVPISQHEARTQLGLPLDKKIVLYKGHLYEWKGAHTMARAIIACPEYEHIVGVFIGGTDKDVAAFKDEFDRHENILILGHRPRVETPVYQKASDVLVIPNSAKDDVSKLYTSPMKLFGYMASGVPIIASDLPSLREIVDDSMVYFFKPDDAQDLARVILIATKDTAQAVLKAQKTLTIAEEYSWQRRAQNILAFINVI